jgi:hypothetical protein
MFLRRILGTPSKPGALPFFSFLIIFLTFLGDVKAEGLTLNTLLCKKEQPFSTVAFRGD